MTYQVSCTGSGSANVDNNTLTITAGDKTGPMTVTIQAFVDGVCIGTRELTINVKGVEQTPGTGNVGGADGATGATGRTDIENSTTLKNNSGGYCNSVDCPVGAKLEDGTIIEKDKGEWYADLYEFSDGFFDFSIAKNACLYTVQNYINKIVEGLITEGYDPDLVNNAAEKTKEYFSKLIEVLKDHNCDQEYLYTEYFNIGEQEYEIKYNFVSDQNYSNAEKEAMDDGASVTVVQNSKWYGYNELAIMIKQSYIIAMFKQFFNAA